MECGCSRKYIETPLDVVRALAKRKAKAENVWYVIVKCSNGNLDFMPEKDFDNSGWYTVVEYVPPVP